MRWPWVGRARLEQEERWVKLLRCALKEAKDELKELRGQLLALHATHRERTSEFIETLTHMQREGFEAQPSPIIVEEEDALPAAIWEAINEVSPKGGADYFTNVAHARDELKAGTSKAEIVERILHGLDVEV